jgi:hypothetical protein
MVAEGMWVVPSASSAVMALAFRCTVQRSRYTKDSRSPVRVSWRGVSAVRRETVVTLSLLSCRAGPA